MNSDILLLMCNMSNKELDSLKRNTRFPRRRRVHGGYGCRLSIISSSDKGIDLITRRPAPFRLKHPVSASSRQAFFSRGPLMSGLAFAQACLIAAIVFDRLSEVSATAAIFWLGFAVTLLWLRSPW